MAKKITPEVRANREKWLQALESGNYEQGQGHLQTLSGGFCCLGVYCEIAGYERQERSIGLTNPIVFRMPDGSPDEYELNASGRAELGMSDWAMAEAMNKNDMGDSFDEIAKWFRRSWRMPRARRNP